MAEAPHGGRIFLLHHKGVLGQFTPNLGLYTRYTRAESGAESLTQAQATLEWRINDASTFSAELRRVDQESTSTDVAGTLGALQATEVVKEILGIDWHETTADGAITLEPVFCLGLCAQAPAAMLDGDLHARIDEHWLTDILAEARS